MTLPPQASGCPPPSCKAQINRKKSICLVPAVCLARRTRPPPADTAALSDEPSQTSAVATAYDSAPCHSRARLRTLGRAVDAVTPSPAFQYQC